MLHILLRRPHDRRRRALSAVPSTRRPPARAFPNGFFFFSQKQLISPARPTRRLCTAMASPDAGDAATIHIDIWTDVA